MSQLAMKIRKARFIILSAVLATSLTSAAPTPTIEIPKQFGLMAADITLCFTIYQVFFGDEVKLTEEKFASFLEEAGIVTVVSGVMSSVVVYSVIKTIQGAHDELMNFAGPLGWLISGSLTGLQTFVIGSLWLNFCEKRYINNPTLKAS